MEQVETIGEKLTWKTPIPLSCKALYVATDTLNWSQNILEANATWGAEMYSNNGQTETYF